MDRRVSSNGTCGPRQSAGRYARVALIAAWIVVLVTANLVAQSASSAPKSADSELASAQTAFAGGDYAGALDLLRQVRSDYPSSPLVADAWALSVQCSFAVKDDYRARFFLQKLIDTAPTTSISFSTTILVARHYYDTRAWLLSLEYYQQAIDLFKEGTSGSRKDLDLALLRATELALYQTRDAATARSFFKRILSPNLPPTEKALYEQMRVRLLWSSLTGALYGLKDENISCLRIDGDDLWVGTWNGGVARYSVSSATSSAFPGPAFSRSVEISDRRVWVATSDGLSWYGKGTGSWSNDTDFQATKVQVVRELAGSLWAGTLGNGLFHLGDSGWEPLNNGGLPGKFITCLAEDDARGRLLIGTMNLGLVVMDLTTGTMSALSDIDSSFDAENITSLLVSRDGRVWIGTYGQGLYVWGPESGTLTHFTKDSGQIGDDWILSSCETDRALYFGSFGGGVSAFLKNEGVWRHIGISDGLASLDIPAIAWRAPYVFFGTLGAGVGVYDEAADGANP